MIVRLGDIAHARSGDKGLDANVGIWAHDDAGYRILLQHLTADAVKAHFGPLCQGEVRRYELPNLRALNFVLGDALGGGGPASLRTDAQGKTYGSALLLLTLEVLEDPDG